MKPVGQRRPWVVRSVVAARGVAVWALLLALPWATVLGFTAVLTAAELGCSGSTYNSRGVGLAVVASLVIGLPVAYVVEMALYWSLYDGPRVRRIGAVLAAAGATLMVALMLFLHQVSGPTELCPAGMPTWWPGWVPHLS